MWERKAVTKSRFCSSGFITTTADIVQSGPWLKSTWKYSAISELWASSFNQILFAQLSFLKTHVYFVLHEISPSYLVWFSLHTLQPKSNAIQKKQTCKPPFQRKMGLWSSWPTVETEAMQTHIHEHAHLHSICTAAGLNSFLSLPTARVTQNFFLMVDHVRRAGNISSLKQTRVSN